jgi:hypothetical protein
MPYQRFVDVEVAQSGLTTLCTINVENYERLIAQIVVAGQALDAFQIQVQTNGDFFSLYSTAADFTSPQGLLVGSSGDLTTQAVGTGWLILDVRGVSHVRLQASSGNVAGSTVSVYAGGQ